jgi:hypothetical protein
MGVTINGKRDVGFATGLGNVWPPKFIILKMQEGIHSFAVHEMVV